MSSDGHPTGGNQKLAGIDLSNDLDKELSDIVIHSVMTDKASGGDNNVSGSFKTAWNYTTDWRTVDTTSSSKEKGNWTYREVIKGNAGFEGTINKYVS